MTSLLNARMNAQALKLFFTGALLVLVSGFALANSLAQPNHKQETLYGIQLGPDQLTIQVKSHGCTRIEHFEVKVEEGENGAQLSIQRLGSDHCRRMPHLISIDLSLPETKKSFYLLNPLQVWRGVVRG